MAENSKIQWTTHTNNLWWGCAKVNAGCKNCYAENLSNRFGFSIWGEKAKRKKIKNAFSDLNKYQKAAAKANKIHKVFVGSMMDIFEEAKPMVDHKLKPIGGDTGNLRFELFQRIYKGEYDNLLFLFLTKRPENIRKMIPSKWLDTPPDNVAFGASVSTQEVADEVFPIMAKIRGHKFISAEPLLEEITISKEVEDIDGILSLYGYVVDWIIVGGESGDNKRPFEADWARKLLEEAKDFCLPFFMKQIDKKKPIPADLLRRDFPHFCNETFYAE